MATYSYSVENGQDSKYFTLEKLLGKEGAVANFEGTEFYILVIDGHHVHCLGDINQFPQNTSGHEKLKSEYFAETDYLRDDD